MRRPVIPNPHIDPILIRFGPVAVRWYGLMYVLGLTTAFFLIKTRAARRKVALPLNDLHDLILYAAIGVILGGRLGYTNFYNLFYYLDHPAKILAVWEGGMSFHGGLIGVIVACWIFCRRKGYSFYSLADLATPTAPIGLGLGRLGNFINGELFGRPTDVPWCMVFDATGGGPLCRHPSQLYEAFLEGVFLFAVVLTAAAFAQSVPPAGYGQPSGEYDITLSRVPIPQRPAAKALKPPFEPTPEILVEGKAIFLGRGTCFQCHGPEGKGDGGAAKILPIQPRNFTNPKFNKVRTPGEMMWVLKNGSLGQTGQIPGPGCSRSSGS